jgi:hypothetical protein
MLDAWLAAKQSTGGVSLAETGTHQQSMRGRVSFVSTRDYFANVGLGEDEVDQLSHRFGPQTEALRLIG